MDGPASHHDGAARPSVRAFEAILRDGPLSRAQLRTHMRVGLSTLTATVQELVKRGLVAEVGHSESTGGRPAGILDLAPQLGGVLAADIGGINTRVAVADCRGDVRHMKTFSTAAAGSERTLKESLIGSLRDGAKRVEGPVRALAISVAGIVDPRNGSISRADNIPGWREGEDLGWLATHFKVPIMIENEANSGALGEYRAGAHGDVESLLFVAIGAGIGAGLVLDGTLYRGANGAAGEVGLLRVGNPAFPVELEQRAAAPAVVAAYAATGGEAATTVEEIFALAMGGDALALSVVNQAVSEIALGIANAVILINPELVVIGGGLGNAGATLVAPLTAALQSFAPKMPRIVSGRLGSDAAIVGAVHCAARLAKRQITNDLQSHTALAG